MYIVDAGLFKSVVEVVANNFDLAILITHNVDHLEVNQTDTGSVAFIHMEIPLLNTPDDTPDIAFDFADETMEFIKAMKSGNNLTINKIDNIIEFTYADRHKHYVTELAEEYRPKSRQPKLEFDKSIELVLTKDDIKMLNALCKTKPYIKITVNNTGIYITPMDDTSNTRTILKVDEQQYDFNLTFGLSSEWFKTIIKLAKIPLRIDFIREEYPARFWLNGSDYIIVAPRVEIDE